jgi:hypothetical protein
VNNIQRGKAIIESGKHAPARDSGQQDHAEHNGHVVDMALDGTPMPLEPPDIDDHHAGEWSPNSDSSQGARQIADSGLSQDSVRTRQRGIRTGEGSPNQSEPDFDQRRDPSGSGRTKGCSPESGSDSGKDRPAYVDVAAMLAGELPQPPEPDVLQRGDGHKLFYREQVNVLFGDPEAGKTFVALAAVTEDLNAGNRALVIDLDHNGAAAILGRLLMLGARRDALADFNRFRLIEPEDAAELNAVVADAETWQPHVVVVDSIGELLPMLGADSNNADDVTRAHTRVLKPLAKTGAAVIAIDHLAKNADSRSKGQTGAAAKRRALGGVSLRVRAMRPFTPTKGGTALLLINKDRHGGVRQYSPVGDREPVAGTFVLRGDEEQRPGIGPWHILAPSPEQRDPEQSADPADLAVIDSMDPKPTNAEQVRSALKCSKDRANTAWAAWKAKQ